MILPRRRWGVFVYAYPTPYGSTKRRITTAPEDRFFTYRSAKFYADSHNTTYYMMYGQFKKDGEDWLEYVVEQI